MLWHAAVLLPAYRFLLDVIKCIPTCVRRLLCSSMTPLPRQPLVRVCSVVRLAPYFSVPRSRVFIWVLLTSLLCAPASVDLAITIRYRLAMASPAALAPLSVANVVREESTVRTASAVITTVNPPTPTIRLAPRGGNIIAWLNLL